KWATTVKTAGSPCLLPRTVAIVSCAATTACRSIVHDPARISFIAASLNERCPRAGLYLRAGALEPGRTPVRFVAWQRHALTIRISGTPLADNQKASGGLKKHQGGKNQQSQCGCLPRHARMVVPGRHALACPAGDGLFRWRIGVGDRCW